MSNVLPSQLSQVIDANSQTSTADLRKAALAAIAEGVDEISEEQLATLSTAEVRELALLQDRKEREAIQAAEIEATEIAEADEFIAQRVVDIGDGSGKQVFTGRGPTQLAAYESLADALQTAQENATKRIRQFSQDQKQSERNAARRAEDDDYVLRQRLANDPTKVVKEMVQQEIAETQAKFNRAQRVQEEFVAAHAHDFFPCPENAQAISQYIQGKGYDEFTPSNLEEAFQALQGKLVKKGSAPATTPTTSGARRTGSSFRSSGGTPPPVKTESEEDLYKMPMDELRRKADSALQKAAEDRDGSFRY